ncbi:MAG: ABC transporter permease [Nocardioides sp.]
MAASTPSTLPATAPQPGRLAMVGRQVDYWATVYKRTWKGSIAFSFVTPLLYVVAMGVLLGGYVDRGGSSVGGAPSYLAFVAPGLLAAFAMQTVVGEVTYPVMGAIKWHKTYYAQLATPLRVADIVAAHFGFVLFRVGTTCGVFMVVLWPFGVYSSPLGAVGALLASVLTGMAFATPIYAFTASLRSEAGFALIFRLLVIPLFLFSGAFFPITNLSPVLEWVARLTPLWHGVDLARMCTLGRFDATAAAVHVTYLLVLLVAGWWLAVRRLTVRLVD